MNARKKEILGKLLFGKFVAGFLPDRQEKQLATELNSSPEARRLQDVLADVSEAVKRSGDGEPEPVAQTRQFLLRALNVRKQQSRASAGSRLADLMRFRIPLYQAGLATCSLALVLLALGRFSSADRSDLDQNKRPVSLIESTVLDSLRSMQGLRMLEHQKRGRNIKQDSVLIKFIITSVDLF